jgi:acetyltransferase
LNKVVTIAGQDVLHLEPGKIGIIFQSGGLLNVMQLVAWDRGWGVNYLVSCGNQAVLSISDYLYYLVKDEKTEVIGILAEEIKNPQKFLKAVRLAINLEKPIIILKIGKSEKAKRRLRLIRELLSVLTWLMIPSLNKMPL